MKLLHRIALGGLLGVSLLFASGTARADKDHGHGHAWGHDKKEWRDHDRDRDHDHDRDDRGRSEWGHQQWRRGNRPVYHRRAVNIRSRPANRTYRSRRHYSVNRRPWR